MRMPRVHAIRYRLGCQGRLAQVGPPSAHSLGRQGHWPGRRPGRRTPTATAPEPSPSLEPSPLPSPGPSPWGPRRTKSTAGRVATLAKGRSRPHAKRHSFLFTTAPLGAMLHWATKVESRGRQPHDGTSRVSIVQPRHSTHVCFSAHKGVTAVITIKCRRHKGEGPALDGVQGAR